MPRWSDLMQLSRYQDYAERELDRPGVYEIGYCRSGWFYPKYIGKAENRLIDRIKTYGRDFGKTSHNATIRELPAQAFHLLYFRVMRFEAGQAAAIREALMLIRHRYGPDTPYLWNGKYELKPLRNAGYAITDVRERV